MSRPAPTQPRRVLVATDLSGHSRAAIEAALGLATRLRAEVLGLFIEDEDLLRFATRPTARVFDERTATALACTREQMEQEMHALAGAARRALEEAAGRAGLPVTFRVQRDHVAAALVEAARAAEILVLGRTGQAARSTRRMGSTARAVVGQAPCAVLLLREGERLGGPVVVLDDGTPAAERALALARDLAAQEPPRVLRLGARPTDQDPAGWVEPERLAARLARLGAGLAVLPVPPAGPLADPAFLETLPCPLLLVR